MQAQGSRFYDTAHYAESDPFRRFEDAHPWIVEHLRDRGR